MPKPKLSKRAKELIKAVRAACDDDVEMQDGDDELAMDAHDASRVLCEIRKAFYGTPIEEILSDAITVCDEVAEIASGN